VIVCGVFRKLMHIIFRNDEPSNATSQAQDKLRKHQDCGFINILEVDGNFRREPTQVA
jgi:hypothetical protein